MNLKWNGFWFLNLSCHNSFKSNQWNGRKLFPSKGKITRWKNMCILCSWIDILKQKQKLMPQAMSAKKVSVRWFLIMNSNEFIQQLEVKLTAWKQISINSKCERKTSFSLSTRIYCERKQKYTHTTSIENNFEMTLANSLAWHLRSRDADRKWKIQKTNYIQLKCSWAAV